MYAYLNLPKDAVEASDFYPSSRLPWIPAKLTLFGDIQLKLKLKDLQRIRKVEDCTDLSQVARTLDWVEQVLWELYKVARRLIKGKLLLCEDGSKVKRDYFNGILLDTEDKSMKGLESGLRRLTKLVDTVESRWSEFLSLSQRRVRALAYRQMGIPPCFTIHNDLDCHCCCFDLKCLQC